MAGIDLERFQQASRNYLHRKGRYDEDLLSEMVLHALEHPETFVSVKNAYLRAIDKLDPRRIMVSHGKKERQSRRTITASALARNDEDDAVNPLDSLSLSVCEAADEPATEIKIKHGPLRAMVLLISLYGYSKEEVAWLFGMTPSRFSQLLGKGRAEVFAGGVPERDFIFAAPAFDLPWMTL